LEITRKIVAVSQATLSARVRARAGSSGLAPHLVILLCVVLWSANATVLKVGLAHVRVLPFTAARFYLAGAVLLAVSSLHERTLLPPPRLRLLLPGAVFGVLLNQLAFTGGLRLTTAVDVSLIQGLTPLFAALVLVVWTGASVPGRQWAALAIGLAGTVAVVATAGLGGSAASPTGDLIAVGAPARWAIYVVLVDRVGDRRQVLALAPWSMLAGAALLTPAAAFFGGPGRDDWLPALLPLAYASLLATALTWSLYFWALPRVGVTGTAIYTYLQPPLGAFFGAVFLQEPVGPGQLTGAVLILVAAYLGSWRGALRRRPDP
jgi:drug/metabolite transporter (DMT)-like permease